MHVSMSLLGEDLCNGHVPGQDVKRGADPESWALDCSADLMGCDDAADGFEDTLVCGSCSFLPVKILS